MAFGKTHEIHERRAGRNIGVAGTLIAFIVVVFGLTMAKISTTGPIEAFDHAPRPALAERVGD
jgi:hypothetical protein